MNQGGNTGEPRITAAEIAEAAEELWHSAETTLALVWLAEEAEDPREAPGRLNYAALDLAEIIAREARKLNQMAEAGDILGEQEAAQ